MDIVRIIRSADNDGAATVRIKIKRRISRRLRTHTLHRCSRGKLSMLVVKYVNSLMLDFYSVERIVVGLSLKLTHSNNQ